MAFPRPAFVRPGLRPLLALFLAALPLAAHAQARWTLAPELRIGGGGGPNYELTWGSPRNQYLVLDRDGRILANVTAPRGMRILQAQRSRVWGVVFDEMDVPSVVRYRVRAGR